MEGRLADLEVGRRLGTGSFGEVYEAFDRRRSSYIALKRLRVPRAADLHRFKREFRALSGIFHPNLATLHELFTDDGEWYIAMELVDGVGLVQYVRRDALVGFAETVLARGRRCHELDTISTADGPDVGANGVDQDRLRSSIVQLVHGVRALHAAGRLHRDLKPSNVLVLPRGTVKVLDFGLVTELGQQGLFTSAALCVGTPAYMAPEQMWSQSVTPAADWYAVGTLLYEALTGDLPFDGDSPSALLAAKQSDAPIDPRERRAGLADDMCDVCMQLLRRDSERRPTADAILEMLEAGPGGSMPRLRSSAAPYVGRDAELAQLRAAFEGCTRGATAALHVTGPSGIGKTALIRAFLRGVEDSGQALVLEGPCYEGDAVPFKAVDTIIDALTSRLLRASRSDVDRILPRDFNTLTRLFPVLQRLRAESPHDLPVSEPSELRRRGFAALRDMLGRIAAVQPLVLAIDDMQWGDADSVALLVELLRAPECPPRILLVLGYRSEHSDRNDVLRLLRASILGAPSVATAIELGPLPPDTTAALAQALLVTSQTPAEADVEAIVRESGGAPLLVHELARYVVTRAASTEDVSLDHLIDDRVARLDVPAHMMLEAASIVASAVDVSVLRDAATLTGEASVTALATLKMAHLARTRRDADAEVVEAYHDRIRERVRQQMDPAVARGWHTRLATVLEKNGDVDPEVIATHFRAAGESARALPFVERAAAAATKALAFDRAAALYKLVVEMTPSGGGAAIVARAHLGDALVNAGRGAEAGKIYVEAASRTADPSLSLELRGRAARAFLGSGHFERGIAALRSVILTVGLPFPQQRLAVIFWIVWERVLLRLRGLSFRPRATIDPAMATRVDVCTAASFGLGMADIAGTVFHDLAARLALRLGDPVRASRCLCGHALSMCTGGARTARRTAEILRVARAVGRGIDDPYAEALLEGASGFAAYMIEDWARARLYFLEAERRFCEIAGATYELASIRMVLGRTRVQLGQMAELESQLGDPLRDALRRNDVYTIVNTRASLGVLRALVRDDVALAERETKEATRAIRTRDYHIQHFYCLVAACNVSLYRDDPESVLLRIRAKRGLLRESLIERMSSVQTTLHHLSARAHLGLAQHDEARRREHLGAAVRLARQLRRSKLTGSIGLASLVIAGTLAIRGRSPILELRAAIACFDRAEMRLHAACARHVLARILGADEGAEHAAAAARCFEAQRVGAPARFVRFYAPGFVAPDEPTMSHRSV